MKEFFFLCNRVTKPGGWIELVEPYSFAIGAGPLFVEFYTSGYTLYSVYIYIYLYI